MDADTHAHLSTLGSPAAFRRALQSVPAAERDRWLDRVLQVESLWEDGPALPRGCAPYLPASADAVLRLLDAARVNERDVFVDVGAGIGRAALLAHLATGASAIGLEIQPHLARAARELTARLGTQRVAIVEGDAVDLAQFMVIGSVFFLYCPFTGARLERVLAALEPVAKTREIRLCCLDLALPERPWLARTAAPTPELSVYRSTFLDEAGSTA